MNDVGNAASHALQCGHAGKHNLCGNDRMNLRQILNTLETAAGKSGTSSSIIPPLDYMWDFFVGTTNDVNLSRMAAFYE